MSTGQKIYELGLKHLGETYNMGVLVPMDDPGWQGPWDCAEFASWLLYQSSGILYGIKSKDTPAFADAHTGYWGAQAESDDLTIDVDQAARIVGAFILRKPTLEKRGHLVISDGQGGTVEAHSKNRGVVAESLGDRKFDFGILIPSIEYDIAEFACSPGETHVRTNLPNKET